MGLGKTVQVLALLCYFKEVCKATQPSLVLVPASVLPNWQAEAARWAPDLRVLTYWGPAAEREQRLRREVGSTQGWHHLWALTAPTGAAGAI